MPHDDLSDFPEIKSLSSVSGMVPGRTTDTPSCDYIKPHSDPDFPHPHTQHVETSIRTHLLHRQQEIRARLGPLPSRKEVRRWLPSRRTGQPEGMIHSDQ